MDIIALFISSLDFTDGAFYENLENRPLVIDQCIYGIDSEYVLECCTNSCMEFLVKFWLTCYLVEDWKEAAAA